MTLRYATGTGYALARNGALVLLDENVGAALVERLWDQLGDEPGVMSVLDVLTSTFGSKLQEFPHFSAILMTEQRAHVIVRGDFSVSLDVVAGDTVERQHLDGLAVTTWSETVVDDVARVAARVGVTRPTGPLLDEDEAMPLISGVVRSDIVRWTLADVPEARADDDHRAARSAATEETIAPPPEELRELRAENTAESEETPSVAESARPEPAASASDVPEVVPDENGEADYSHLWGSTVMRSVEKAAVRPEPAAVPAEPTDSGGDTSGGRLIAGIPREWGESKRKAPKSTTGGAQAEGAPAPAPEVEAVPLPSASSATARPAKKPVEEPEELVDHDGHTVMRPRIDQLRAALAEMPPAPAPGQQHILARICPQGHANPPSREFCALCNAPLEDEADLTIRPALGQVVVSTGQVVELDRGVIIGRRPRSPRGKGADAPHLVTVPSPQNDISRSHVEVRLEGWHVLVSDMNTTNGTTLLRVGQPPRRLHPSEQVLVVDGDVVDMGDGITMTFKGLR